ncbi:unnamed protein product, partial [Didymodactylos carnosus]
KHYKDTGHQFTSDNFRITLPEKHKYKLLLKESLAIRAIAFVLNGTDRSVPLYVYPGGVKRTVLPKHVLGVG